MELYRCNTCDNIITKIIDSTIELECCGDTLEHLQPQMTDGDKEKHVPIVTRRSNMVEVTVGQIAHPMTESHHIMFVGLVTDKGFQIHYLNVATPPTTRFFVGDEETITKVVAYCDIHGLFETTHVINI